MNTFIFIILSAFIKTETLNISSPAFSNGGMIPQKYTCEGSDINPPISISGVPDGTKSLTLIMDDPDAPNGTFDHWIVWNIDPDQMIGENTVPGIEGKNGMGLSQYKGPCPPNGTHHYYFKVYALDIYLDLKTGADKKTIEAAMQGHIITTGELIGLYKKVK